MNIKRHNVIIKIDEVLLVYCIAMAVAKNIDNSDATEEVLVEIKVINQIIAAQIPIILL